MHTIRSLHRGLKALEILNDRKTISVAEMARAINLPRTTAFRILENLCSAGYVHRSGETGQYGLTIRVRNLSSGFNDEAWLSEVVRPLATELSKQVVWPVSITSPRYQCMSLRFTTDASSPMAIDYYKEGTKLPIFTTASGHVYLAFGTEQERALLVQAMREDKKRDDSEVIPPDEAIDFLVKTVRAEGFALNVRSPRTHAPGKTSVIAVPIMRDGQFLAALSMRYIDSALDANQLKERYLPTLQDYAKRMEHEFQHD